MIKIEVLTLPLPSSVIDGDPVLCTDKGNLLLLMNFNESNKQKSISLQFIKQRAFRKVSEIYCTKWHVENVYDTVCEIHDSDWVGDMRNNSVPEWREHWVMRHFMIYIDSFGCIEVIAENVKLNIQE